VVGEKTRVRIRWGSVRPKNKGMSKKKNANPQGKGYAGIQKRGTEKKTLGPRAPTTK